jgi:uncharacterized damage-inducible protein DinB
MTATDVILDGFGRIREIVHDVLDGISQQQLDHRLDADANSIGWLIWHLTRVQDDHIAGAGDLDQVYLSQGWADQFGLPLDPADMGYGHDTGQVALVQATASLLSDYHDATYAQTTEFVSSLTESDLARVVDKRWDPPVTMSVRLVSVLADDLEHAGQAAFVRGILERR